MLVHVAPRARSSKASELFHVGVQQGRLLVATTVTAIVDEHAKADDASEVLLKRRPGPETRGLRVLDAPSNAVALAELDEGESLTSGRETSAGMTLPGVR
eukprot:7953006-Heterocapsa_arctica.AAC.1